MDLKIKDVAELLNVSESTINRWLLDGKIPAYKINDQYRFSRMEIENWVMKQKPEQNEIQTPSGGNKQFSLYRAIHKGGVLSDVPGKTKEEVIRNTMKILAKDLNLDADVISELLIDRERLQSTALNHGIGIPHTRECIVKPGQDIVAVVFPEEPIPYGALDGKPVHTLFFLFASEDKKHLHLLAKIAHLSGQSESAAFIRQKPSKERLLDYIKEWEAQTKE